MSNINPNNIDGQYPIAGQDNDSQGFRDNFTNIKNNLNFAKLELEDLQAKVLLKQPLAGTSLNNDVDGAEIAGVKTLRFRESSFNIVATDGAITVDWRNGQFQYLGPTTGNVTSLTLIGWPSAPQYAKLRLFVDVDVAGRTLTLSSAGVVYHGLSGVQGSDGTIITFSSAGRYLFEFSSDDEGDNVFVEDVLRNYKLGTEDYQYLTPLAGEFANITLKSSTVIINPSGTIASANINFPANTSIIDGQTLSFAFGATITTATMYGNGATISGALTTAGTTTPAKFIYKKSTNTWYRTV